LWLSSLLVAVGHRTESKRLLTHLLKLRRDQGDPYQVAKVLVSLSDVHRAIDLYQEAIEQAKEALEIFEQLNDTAQQAYCFSLLALCLLGNKQVDIAEETASHAITLLSQDSKPFLVYSCHWALGEICRAKGNIEKSVEHFEVALGIASSHDWQNESCIIHYFLGLLFVGKGRLDDASAHLEQAELYVVNNATNLARAMLLQADIFLYQHRNGEAKSQLLRAAETLENIGATEDAARFRELAATLNGSMVSFDCPEVPPHLLTLLSSGHWLKSSTVTSNFSHASFCELLNFCTCPGIVHL
jgi:tetratricopeptide (TPR) repeat protein